MNVNSLLGCEISLKFKIMNDEHELVHFNACVSWAWSSLLWNVNLHSAGATVEITCCVSPVLAQAPWGLTQDITAVY